LRQNVNCQFQCWFPPLILKFPSLSAAIPVNSGKADWPTANPHHWVDEPKPLEHATVLHLDNSSELATANDKKCKIWISPLE
jgi:hypothetical protein